MKHHKDIFDLFRDNQHKLNERPSPEAWRRLERRLDNHRVRHRSAFQQPFGMVAAIVVLAVLVSILAFMLDRSSSRLLAVNGQPIPVENLIQSDVDVEALKVVEFTKQYQEEIAYPIREGSQGRKLIPTATKTKAQLSAKGDLLLQLDWLNGTWQEGNGAKKSVEQWKRVGKNKLEGKGLLLQGEQVLFEENLSIQSVGKDIILKTYTNTDKKATVYNLSQLGYQWVLFENLEVDFPQQIIIQFDGKETLSTLYQNPQLLNMSRYQLEYMQQRNQLVRQRALRQLKKVPSKGE
ncbi:MAG: DUF6265 family protein [Bacteroidota bacterium]